MNTSAITGTLVTLATELVDGAPEGGAYMLNGGDPGMLGSLDRLSAAQASASVHDGATIAAHVEHVAYGLSLLNRWSAGERNPWADADWSRAWRRTSVDDAEWEALRGDLRAQARMWVDSLRVAREVHDVELNGLVGSIAHLAYHLGAIRQIDKSARGPRDGE